MKNLIVLLFIFSSVTNSQAQILKKPIPDKLVVLTFDDAPASHYSIVAPMLKEFGFGGTFFVCEFQPNYADSTL
ncbi:Polysaccharide deacetylase [Algoriphagus aquimarinus]|uniref:Polysaccharide deacetylase n=2 Tax=Algoriphagus aquimarinus TaxID=237018 RepID=A0A1I0XGV7_9BACT|nr:Polysaccharide deacetylase [Algoriphagus aquimarinus]